MLSIHARRGLSSAALLFVVWAVSGCGTTSRFAGGSGADRAAQKVTESLQAADKAHKLGKTEEALAELDAAIKVDPASKLPWLRKAQIYFDARQYGQAITAAQETLQRDTTDLTAKSILAVSGLRVSAQALEQLRKANEVNGSARTEAESVVKLIREALGEPILVPPMASASTPEIKKTVPRSPTRARVSAPTPVVTTSAPVGAFAAKPPVARALSTLSVPPPAAGGGNNPFGALK